MTDVLERPAYAGAPDQPRGARRRNPLRGNPGDPAWVRPGLLALLLGTAVLYLWHLSASGNANTYYAAAAQAGSQSWKAWFFGALDAGSSITVDKPPASLWVMGLSARVFGYSSWSLLVPQALEGVAAVGLLHATVRRVAGPAAGLLAGLTLALTPAAALMFRFDNPDALLVLLVVAATYCVTRALEQARTRWLVLAGVALGLGFLTKSGQALLVVPALGLAYLVCAPTGLFRRVRQLLLALVALVASAGWYVGVVALWPADSRPYIGGSTDNSALELAFGYNGLARLFGGQGNGGGNGGGGGGGGMGGSGNTSFGGSTGLTRMFHGEFALEISWLLPAALIAIGALAWMAWGRPRMDADGTGRARGLRGATIVWGGTLLVTAGVFSFMQGTIHPYYSVALAPSIAALVAIAGVRLWQRGGLVAGTVLAAMVFGTADWGLLLLHRNGAGTPVVAVGIVLALLALAGIGLHTAHARLTRRTGLVVALVTVLALAVPTATWGVATAGTAHGGSIPTAATLGSGSSSSQGGGMRGGTGGPGGGGGTSSTALTTALQKTTTTWAAATVGAQSAASLELASGTSVIGIGGFSGSDDAPTLAQFKAWVAAGEIGYFVSGSQGGQGGGPGGQGGSGSASEITAWVTANYSATTIGGQTVYDLTS